jgi:hypothetical protein
MEASSDEVTDMVKAETLLALLVATKILLSKAKIINTPVCLMLPMFIV